MDKRHLDELLQKVASGETSPVDAYEVLKTLPFQDLGFVFLLSIIWSIL